MICRETIWHDEAQGELQYSFAMLDEVWEVVYEATYPCGPFHSLADRRSLANDDWRRWLLACGHQGELEL